MEPIERLMIDVPEESMGSVMESLGTRKAEMVNMNNGNGRASGILDSRSRTYRLPYFLTLTRGYGIANAYSSYGPLIGGRRVDVTKACWPTENGSSTFYGMMSVEDRGTLFLEPGTEIYEGDRREHTRDNDIVVNICKEKQLTNVRSATKDDTVKLKTPVFSLEQAPEYLNDDEYCEITPKSVRLRKKILNKSERERAEKHRKMRKQIYNR